jgi:hypothetical protein
VRDGPGPAGLFLVLDGYGKAMDQIFPGGLHNPEWAVTGYRQFGAILRAEHNRGVRGLIPLLTTLYAGSPESLATWTPRHDPPERSDPGSTDAAAVATNGMVRIPVRRSRRPEEPA